MIKKLGESFHFAYGSRREFLTALYPFFLFGFVLPVINFLGQSKILTLPNPIFAGISIILVGLLGLLLLGAFVTGFPRWSLPSVGLLLSLVSTLFIGTRLNHSSLIPFQAFYNRSWFLGQVAYQGSLWAGLTGMALLLAILYQLIPVFRRFRTDWTLLAFLLYGATPFALMFTFDDYRHEEAYEILAFLMMVTGIWLYLHANNPRQRFWALFGAMTVSLLLAGVTKAIIYQYFWDGSHQYFTWWIEMLSTVIMWMWIALSMLVPFTVGLFAEKKAALTTGTV